MRNMYRYQDEDHDFIVEQLGAVDEVEDHVIVIVTDPKTKLNGTFMLLPRSNLTAC